MEKMAAHHNSSPTNSHKIRTPSATVSRPGTSTPIVITSFAMKDVENRQNGDFFQPDSLPVELRPMETDMILDKLKDCDAIKYAAYRTATKLDILRSGLRLDQVKLGALNSAFHQHGFRSWKTLSEQNISESKARDVVADMFFSAGKIRPYFGEIIDVAACTETALKIAIMMYGNDNHIGAAFLKVFFIVLCESRLKDKLAYLFKDFAYTENGLMNKQGIKAFLTELTRISDFLGESESFGSTLIDSTVAQCFQVTNQRVLDEDAFFKWIFKEPQVIVWLPTYYRLIASKSIRHDVRCANCKSQVIIGMRYQCLQCLNYDLCQHCFFYGFTSQNHKLSHPMQEYCYKSSRKEATRALLKLISNNLGLNRNSRRMFKKKRKRYLPHDPNMILEKTIVEDNNTIIEQPVTVEALNLQPPITMEEGCGGSSGFHSVSSQSPVQPKEDFKERQTQFNSIVQKMEEETAIVLDRLTSLQASRNKIEVSLPKINTTESLSQPIDSCVTMQAQLNRLKLLMEGLFGYPETEGSETPMRSKKQIVDQRQSILLEIQNSLTEPSMVESTPMITALHLKNHKNLQIQQKKKLSRIALDNNFSPIVFKEPKPVSLEKKMPVNAPVFDETILVDTLLDNDENIIESIDSLGSPTLSKVQIGDITSFLAKTGIHQNIDQDLQITKMLLTKEEEEALQECNGDLMDEMEQIMTRMEAAFATFKDPKLVRKRSQSNLILNDAAAVGQLVAEISDLIHAQVSKEQSTSSK